MKMKSINKINLQSTLICGKQLVLKIHSHFAH